MFSCDTSWTHFKTIFSFKKFKQKLDNNVLDLNLYEGFAKIVVSLFQGNYLFHWSWIKFTSKILLPYRIYKFEALELHF